MKTRTKKLLLTIFTLIMFLGAANMANAQYLWNDTTAFKAGQANSGRLWGYAFGDFAYKGHADSLSRGGSNQYTGIPASRTTFQFRRIYLGYDYNISSKFSAELLLAAEDNFPAGNPPVAGTTSLSTGNSTGDILTNQKLTFYIKLANVRWKNIWKGTDLAIGQVATPAFPLLAEKIWSYRSVERTISDIRRTPSYDMGATLQGVFDPATKNIGYDVMVGNGTSAKPENDNFKWFYADVYAYLFQKHVVLDLYGDYERLNWSSVWHHSRSMVKGFLAWNSSATSKSMNPGTGYTIGVEGFINTLKNDLFATKIAGGTDTLTNAASGLSMYIHGDIIPNKLRFFARLDLYNPMNKVNNTIYSVYKGNTSNYNDNSFTTQYNYAAATPTVTYTATNDETYKQTFVTAGLDYKPAPRVHFMPNIWYESYKSQIGGDNQGHDVVYRLTFFYAFGKNYDNGGF